MRSFRSFEWWCLSCVILIGTAGSLNAAPLPRPRTAVVYLPLPPQMEAAIRDSEEFHERNVKEQEKIVAEANREEFDDGTVVKTAAYVRRAYLLEMIRLCRLQLDPVTGQKETGDEPRSALLEKALRQRLEMYKMRLERGIADGTVAREDWVGPDRRPR